ncbi:MAG: carboxypeptidase-like regulatory domain-containing protein, partial [Bacteroidota bacterium]
MRKVLLISTMLIWANVLFGQEKSVTGKVISSEDGTPLPGVSVAIKGTTKGSTTNGEGVYNVTVSPNATLVFSFLGFDKQEIKVGNSNLINVSLQTDISNLNEVVVIGYGVQKKSKLT